MSVEVFTSVFLFEKRKKSSYAVLKFDRNNVGETLLFKYTISYLSVSRVDL